MESPYNPNGSLICLAAHIRLATDRRDLPGLPFTHQLESHSAAQVSWIFPVNAFLFLFGGVQSGMSLHHLG